MTLTFNARTAMVTTDTHAKIKVKSHPLQALDWKQTGGQTDVGDCVLRIRGSTVMRYTN